MKVFVCNDQILVSTKDKIVSTKVKIVSTIYHLNTKLFQQSHENVSNKSLNKIIFVTTMRKKFIV